MCFNKQSYNLCRNYIKNNTHILSAFTIIELIVIMMIVSIISLTASGILIFFLKNTLYLPVALNTQLAASSAMDAITEGDQGASGLRFLNKITTIKTNNDTLTFVNKDNQSVSYRLRNNQLERQIEKLSWEKIPYYADNSLRLTKQQGKPLFVYYDKDENHTANTENVRRVEVNLLAIYGSGDIENIESQTALTSSVAIRKFNAAPVLITLWYVEFWKRYRIAFWVYDADSEYVSWNAGVLGDPGGSLTLTKDSGTGRVLYREAIWYKPTSGYNGKTTITITIDDGAGGVSSGELEINV